MSDAARQSEREVRTIDPFVKYHKIKSALVAANMHAEAMEMDDALNFNIDFASAWGFGGGWQRNIRHRGFDEAMRSMKTSKNNSENATNLIRELDRWRHRQSGPPGDGKNAALQIILNASKGKIQCHTSYRKKFAKI